MEGLDIEPLEELYALPEANAELVARPTNGLDASERLVLDVFRPNPGLLKLAHASNPAK